jgi:nitrite reductase/ring-hydroxylating ferredoxin subunit
MRFLINSLIWFLKLVRPQLDASPGRVYVGAQRDFPLNTPRPVDVNDESVLVVRTGEGQFCAVTNRCAHLPVPLEGGRVEDGTIVCPFHNSRFDLCTGDNLDWTPGVGGVRVPNWTRELIAMGQPPRGVQAYPVTVEGDSVYVDVYVREG